jgi:hypothetical protein
VLLACKETVQLQRIAPLPCSRQACGSQLQASNAGNGGTDEAYPGHPTLAIPLRVPAMHCYSLPATGIFVQELQETFRKSKSGTLVLTD